MKPRLQPYVSPINHARVRALAKHPNKSESKIVDEALDAYFANSADGVGGNAIVRRLDRLTRQFDRLEQKDLVLSETLALFIRYFMMATPAIPSERQDAARAQGELRFDSFIEQLGRELQTGRSLLQRAIDETIADETDFFTREELDRLAQPAPPRKPEARDHA